MKHAGNIAETIRRALKPGGRFVAEFGGAGNIAAVRRGLVGVLGSEAAAARDPWYFPSIGEYAALLERHGLEPVFAELLDRPTEVPGQSGLREWLTMFAGTFFAGLPAERVETLYGAMEVSLRPELYRDGIWTIDYRRLRVKALKPAQ
jgi:SAM-dependent methyltransferase